ncbi:hypothetical protein BJ875DRAFT_488613 [Amylocarpus encephaloides]|uniref:Enterotoxin n=1 Tax=Amylocarpus encephaloides TaxID=45428 RepID=A0A9P7Y9Z0_9HELO|nr:hypothetical protein BJ875DRAFT_488613 [Amylocarpus encephaloides]
MKTISIVTALVGLRAVGIYALVCNTDNPLGDITGADIASTLQNGENGPVMDVCRNMSKDIKSGPIRYDAGPLSFQISRTGSDAYASGYCNAALTSIISQCVVIENVWGGSVETEGLSFEVLAGGNEGNWLEVRGEKNGRAPGKKIGKPKKPTTKTKTKKLKTTSSGKKPKSTKSTSLKSTKSKSPKSTKSKKEAKSTKTQKDKSTKSDKQIKSTKTKQPKSTKTTKSSKCTQTGKGKKGTTDKGKRADKGADDGSCSTSKLDCKEAYARAVKQQEEEDESRGIEGIETSTLIGRDFSVGGMSGMAYHEVSKRGDIQKRTEKEGIVCDIAWKANNYPSKKHLATEKTDYYGWSDPTDCDIYEWKGPFSEAERKAFRDKAKPPKKNGKGKEKRVETKAKVKVQYDLEHILEFQSITGFFHWIDRTKMEGNRFPDPHGGEEKVNFCKYFKGTWDLNPFRDPKDKTKATILKGQKIPLDGVEKTPMDHIVDVYPSTDQFENEFVYLERTINQGAKANAFSPAKGDTVYSKSTTTNNIEKDPTVQIIRLKALLGLRKYIRTKVISDNFNKQQKRIGEVLGKLDSELEKHPKVFNSKQEEKAEEVRVRIAKDRKVENARKKAANKKTDEEKKMVADDETNAAEPDSVSGDKPTKRAEDDKSGSNSGGNDDNNDDSGVTTLTPWKKLGLEALWGEWMDLRFEIAENRLKLEMDEGIKRLHKKWDTDAKIKEGINKLEMEWKKEKTPWTIPWAKHQKVVVPPIDDKAEDTEENPTENSEPPVE